MKTPFVKMHGNGNDFVIIDNIEQNFSKDVTLIKKIANRRIGIGCDQLILIEKSDKYDAFIALGCVIKGKTPHFDLICNSTFNAIMHLSVNYNKPIGNGIITAFNINQAKERCGLIKSKKPNKGLEAAKAVMSILINGPKKI